MAAPVHRAPEIGDAADDTGRRFVVHDDDGFQLARRVVFQALLECFRRRAAAPRPRHVFDVEAEPFRDLSPRDMREPAGFENQNAIAWRERIHERRFGRAGARCREYDDRTARAEDAFQSLEHLEAKLSELRAAVIDRGLRDFLQHTIGNVRRPGNLQEMPPCMCHKHLPPTTNHQPGFI